jgi:hypothetical protein
VSLVWPLVAEGAGGRGSLRPSIEAPSGGVERRDMCREIRRTETTSEQPVRVPV